MRRLSLSWLFFALALLLSCATVSALLLRAGQSGLAGAVLDWSGAESTPEQGPAMAGDSAGEAAVGTPGAAL